MPDPAADIEEYDAVVVGAGFAGLYAIHRLRNVLGLRVHAFEAGSGVGGTWFWNRYPGARCDSDSYVYCFSFDADLCQEWSWSGRYPRQPEILSYLEHVAERYELATSISFETRVLSMSFDEARRRWRVRTDTGRLVTARFVVTAVGILASAAHRPDLPGIDDFEGEIYHTGAWPHNDVDLTGKRVAVIGTGSSGVQIIPEIAAVTEHLFVLQRTANYVIPAQHHRVDQQYLDEVKARYADVWDQVKWSAAGYSYQGNGRSALDDTPEQRHRTYTQLWNEGGFAYIMASYKDQSIDRRANDYAAEFVRAQIRAVVTDRDTAERLVPVDHPLGGRRPVIGTDYYQTYNRDNVTLLDLDAFPLQRMTQHGFETAEASPDIDILIMATGFDAVTGPFMKIDIEGIAGTTLTDKWADGPQTYLGFMSAGFPNLFMVTGPGSIFSNLPGHRTSGRMDIERDRPCDRARHRDDRCGTGARDRMDGTRRRRAAALAPAARRRLMAQRRQYSGKKKAPLIYTGHMGSFRQFTEDVASSGYQTFDLRDCDGSTIAPSPEPEWTARNGGLALPDLSKR